MSMSTGVPGTSAAHVAPLAADVVSTPPRDDAGGVYQAGFTGWLAVADVLSEVNPEMADAMVAGAYVARATLEEHIPSLLSAISEELELPSSVVDGLAGALGAGTLELTAESAAEMLFDFETVQVFQDGPNRFSDIDDAIHGFLKTRLVTPGRGAYDDLVRQMKEHQPSTDFAHWKATCSLDLPSVLGNGQQPIYCVRPGHRELGTQLHAREYTYFPQAMTGFKGRVTGAGPVGVDGGYRKDPGLDINEQLPHYFVRSFESNTAAQGWVYALYLTEGSRARTIAKLVALLPGQSERVGRKVAEQIGQSQQRFTSVMTSLQIPAAFINPLISLIALAAQALVPLLVKELAKRFRESRLTPWTIWHTVLMGSERVPVSIFTLTGRDSATTPPLCRLMKSPGGEWSADDRYDGSFAAEQAAARFMIGQTQIPTTGIDAAWFDVAAQSGQPLAWQDPLESRGGFRVLLPHLERDLSAQDDELHDADRYRKLAAKSKPMYLSAVRADVHLEFEAASAVFGPITAVRRTGGRARRKAL